MSFNDNGFLDAEIAGIAAEIKQKHKDYFAFCYDLNAFAEKEKFKFVADNQNGQQVIAACLFARILESYQGSIILLERGMPGEAMVLQRVALEALIILKKICKDKDFVREYVSADEIKRRTIINIAFNYPEGVFGLVKEYAMEDVIKQLETKIRDENISKLKIEQLAKDAGLSYHYDTLYRLASDAVHTSPRFLERYAQVAEDGRIVEILHGPSYEEAPENLCLIAELLLHALRSMFVLFIINDTRRLDDHFIKLKSLWDVMPDK